MTLYFAIKDFRPYLHRLNYSDQTTAEKQCLVYYFVKDGLGGYQKEETAFFVDIEEILHHIKPPEVKKIGRYRSTNIFWDF